MYEPLTTLAAIKALYRITGTADDALIETGLIPRASEVIGRFCGRTNLGKVTSFTENYYPGQRGRSLSSPEWNIVLRHYPVVSLGSALLNNAPLTVLANTDLQIGTAGAFLQEDDEPRVIQFRGIVAYSSSPVLITYTAGYTSGTPPPAIQQACNQLVMEMLRKSATVNQRSVAMQGETTSFDMGGTWGMSNYVQAMLQPFRNVIPFYAR